MNVNPYEISWRTDSDGRPISVYIVDKDVTVPTDGYVLDEIPDTYERVTIKTTDGTRLVEKTKKGGLEGNQFYVDYCNGIVYFSPTLANTQVNITYYGRGYKKVSSIRVKNVVFEGDLTNAEIDSIIAQLEAMKK